jgi:60 kDa SS-A/Ro ribonucleoprotein
MRGKTMADALTAISTRKTPQSEKADPRQVKNNAGGYVFQVGDETRVNSFLTLGTDGGTYYVTEADLTKDNAQVILAAARDRGEWLVERIVEISVAGRAPRQNPAIFALAAVSALGGTEAARRAANDAVSKVCRTGTHLYLFTRYAEQFRGWGGGLRRAVRNWYLDKPVESVAYQAIKYRQREGWSHRDLLRLSHPQTDEPERKALFDWMVKHEGKDSDPKVKPALVDAFEKAQEATTVAQWVELVTNFRLPWEALPDAAVTQAEVWHALIAAGVPMTALIRQLPRLTNLGVFNSAQSLATVTAQLQDTDKLRKARIHPINALVALRTYSRGQSMMGENTWSPKRQIVDALDSAFYRTFGTFEPSNKRHLLALDVSGSMGSPAQGAPRKGRGGYRQPNYSAITCREVTAALALFTMATEPACDVIGFTGGGWGRSQQFTDVSELALSPRQRLDDAVRTIERLPFGSTDCALPMLWAGALKKEYDVIEVLTDNETWAGAIHPQQALKRYRETSGINTRLAVVALTPTEFTIADPADEGTLDVSGFDSNVPNLLADFARGAI